MCTKNRKLVSNILMETARKVPGRPREGPRTIVQSSGEKYFSTKFQKFCAKHFSSFRNFPGTVLDTVTTKFDETGSSPINIT